MHTSLILFNGCLAFWTFFGIYSHPKLRVVRSTRVFFHFLLKKISVKAFKRNMSFFIAFEAKSIPTITENILGGTMRVDYNEMASRSWAILESFV